jgi:hypothetical protein
VLNRLLEDEEPVLGEHWQDRGDRVVKQVEAGDEGPRIAEPCGQRVGEVARDDVGAAAFDDREVWRQEPLDVGPRDSASRRTAGQIQNRSGSACTERNGTTAARLTISAKPLARSMLLAACRECRIGW